ncbi:MAG: hypothetical protein ACXWO3_07030 [Isosphaeraceae bacterium]
MIVLDTDYMSLLQWSKGTNRMPFLQRVRSLEAENLATTIVTYEEQTRDLNSRGVATAIAKLESSGILISNELHVLNHWR